MNGELPDQPNPWSVFKRVLRYAALASLVVSLVFLWMLLSKPALPPAEASAEAAASFAEKLARLTRAHELGMASEVHFTAAEINSQIQEWLKTSPPPDSGTTVRNGTVSLEDDRLIAVLTLEVRGIELYLTVDGRLNFASHTVRLVPSEIHIGKVALPVAWFERKIDMHMELPEAVTAARVESGALVIEAQ
ncbi:MAG: hypothetical protein ABSG54_01040 [Terriglobia bacterium]